MPNDDDVYAENAALRRENLRLRLDAEQLAWSLDEARFARGVWRLGFWILSALLCVGYVIFFGR